MITIDLVQNKASTLCQSVIDSIQNQILNGELKANQKLPSKRSLAQHLGISVITIQNAYSQLISEGYIYSIEKSGYFVTDIQKEIFLSKKIQNNNHSLPKTSLTEASKKTQSRKWFADFTNNSTSVEKFPFSLWSKTIRQILATADENLLQRSNVYGTEQLRNAIAVYLREFRNMNVDPCRIVIGAGTESLYSMLVQLLGRECIYAVENPGYHKVAAVFNLNGAKCIPVDLDQSGISVASIKKSKASVVHVSPSHHFPTGIVMPVKRRMELLSWASQKDKYIIEDDYDSEFRFNGKPLPTLQSSDSNDSVIYMNTFSKTLSPSFRISYMVLPQKLLQKFEQKLGFYSCQVSAIEQYALAQFISSGSYGKHIIRMKNYYRTLRNQLIQNIKNSTLANSVEILEQESGLHFLLKVKSRTSGSSLKQKLQKQGINIQLVTEYFYQEPIPDEYNNTFVLNYSGIKKENLEETVRRMEIALN